MLNKYLSDLAVEKLQYALLHEKENSAIYTCVSIWLMSKGLKNLSEYYDKWSTEEFTHSQWVKEFMIQLDVPISAGKIEIEDYKFDESLDNFSKVTLDRENLTTLLYRDIMDLALDMEELGSAMLLDFAQKMSHEQAEETDKALTLFAQISNLGNNLAFAQLFDNSFEG